MQFQALGTIVNGEVQRGTKVKAFVSFFVFRKLRKVRGVMGKLEGKVAVITGASKGIGEGIAKVYAKYGAKCVLAARGPKVLELAEQLKSEGYEAKTEVNKSAILEKRKLEKFNEDFEKYESDIYMEFNDSEWKGLSIRNGLSLDSSFDDIFNTYFGK